jgi:membrane protein YdbS with pleckstrin-like domain
VNVLKALWAAIEGNPRWMQSVHGWLTLIWFFAAFPIMFFWSENITFLVFVSVYAVVTGHWSSWQASRVEVRQDEIEVKREDETNRVVSGDEGDK